MSSSCLRLDVLLLPALLSLAMSVAASDITIETAATATENGIIVLSADATLEFSDDATNALESGIPLIFELEIRISKPVKFFWDRKLFSTQRRYSIERHALSEQFIVTDLVTGDRRIHESLELAIEDLGRVRQLPVVERIELKLQNLCDIRIRLRLDIESLPAPMIPIAYVSPGWYMSSGWHRWQVNL
jgi:hypothetical protein